MMWKTIIKIIVIVLLVLFISLMGLYYYLSTKYEYLIIAEVNERQYLPNVAIVFGAGYWAGNFLPPILEDRVLKAIELYKAGIIEKMVMSGDNSQVNYNEPAAMKQYAEKKGIPVEDIICDYAGFRTYDTLYRARDVFNLDNILLITQEYHLPRALYICNELGIHGFGVPCDRRNYTYEWYYKLREIPAILLAWIDVKLLKPLPKFLGPKEDVFKDERDNE